MKKAMNGESMNDSFQNQILSALIELKQDVGEVKGALKSIQSQVLKTEERFCVHSDDNFAHGAKASHNAFDRMKDLLAIGLSVISLCVSLYMAKLYAQNFNGINHQSRP